MDNKEYEYFYNKGIAFNDEGKFTLAIDNYLKALSISPDSIEAHFNLGVVYINKKEYELAISSFDHVLSINPDEEAAFSNIALAYGRSKNYDMAIKYYKKVLDITPDDTDTFKDLADVYLKKGDHDTAIDYYNRALKLNPYMMHVKKALQTAINLKNQALANPNPLHKYTMLYDNIDEETEKTELANQFFYSGVKCIKEQNIDGAIEHFRHCLKIDPDYANAYNLLNKMLKLKEQAYRNQNQ